MQRGEDMPCLDPECGGELSEGYWAIFTHLWTPVVIIGYRRCMKCGLAHSSSGQKLIMIDGEYWTVTEEEVASAS